MIFFFYIRSTLHQIYMLLLLYAIIYEIETYAMRDENCKCLNDNLWKFLVNILRGGKSVVTM